MGADRANLVWTDPPYGVAYVGKTADALVITNDTLTPGALRGLLDSAFSLALSYTRPGSAWYVASPPGPLHMVFGNALVDLEIYRQQIIWVKDQFVLGHADYHYRHEPIFYGFSPAPKGTGRLGRGGKGWHGDNAQDTVWEIPRPRRSTEHPTMKPVELVLRSIGNSTAPGELLIDPFGGSGTTLIAAQLSGRVARLIELDPRYCDVICARWQELTGEMPTNAAGEAVDFTSSI